MVACGGIRRALDSGEMIGTGSEDGRERRGASGDGQTLSILVVEDDATLSELLRSLLNSVSGWASTVVHDAPAARAVLRHVQMDAMVLDVNLPGISGIELLDGLAGDGWNQCPVLLTSADERQDKIEAALKRHQDVRFLRKPFDLDEVVEELEAAVGGVKRRQGGRTSGRGSATRPRVDGKRERAAA